MQEKITRLGIDVGGTHTDAVVISDGQVLAGVKSSTSRDVMSGVLDAMHGVLDKAAVRPEDIDGVMVGTTHFTNAVVERRHLDEVAVVRLALPATAAVPPLTDWPDDLAEAIGRHVYLAKGGNEFNGRPISQLDEEELLHIAKLINSKNLRAIVISSVFAPIQNEIEKTAAALFSQYCPSAAIVCSHTIGRLGLLERENAAIINASLLSYADHTVRAFETALAKSGISCPFFLTQNDGTLMSAKTAKAFPVLTFASGPTNSMRGAAFLSGAQNAIVVDIGGTTSDIGALRNGFPQQAATVVDIGGVRTNFRMPDVFSVGLGGGSIICESDDGTLQIGPRSVGYKLKHEALVFGGNTLTSSDIAVAVGAANFGDIERLRGLDPLLVSNARKKMTETLRSGVERSRTSTAPITVIGVGGGSILLPETLGDLRVIRPENFAVANAIGAAIAQVSGEVDRVFSLDNYPSREACLREAEEEAIQKAIAAGAIKSTLSIIERDEVPMSYLPGNATRVQVKVVGDLGGTQTRSEISGTKMRLAQ